MERTIRVTGRGKIAVAPDTVRIMIKQSEIAPTYEGAVNRSAEQKNEINVALSKLDFKKEDVKTLSFDVSTRQESYQAKDKSWKQRFLGYEFTHRMKLEFPKDSGLLGKVIGALAKLPSGPEFSLQFTVSDPETAKNELLAKAVADSAAKARVLTEASGVKLGGIQTIDYSWGEVEFVSRPMDRMMEMECITSACLDLDIEPEDIDMTDTVTVVWEIE